MKHAAEIFRVATPRRDATTELCTEVGGRVRSGAMGGRPATAVVSHPDGTPTVFISGELDLVVAATIERQLVALSDTHDRVDLDVSALGSSTPPDCMRCSPPRATRASAEASWRCAGPFPAPLAA